MPLYGPPSALGLFVHKRLGHLACTLLALSATSLAHAVEVDGLKLPDELMLEGKRLIVNGAGTRLYSFLRVKVYSAALYAPAKSSDAAALLNANYPRAVVIKMRTAVKKDDTVKAWEHFLGENCKSPCNLQEASKVQFLQSLAGLKDGDEEHYLFTSEGLELKRNGQAVNKITDVVLAKTVLAGWIGSYPTTAELKDKLLGL